MKKQNDDRVGEEDLDRLRAEFDKNLGSEPDLTLRLSEREMKFKRRLEKRYGIVNGMRAGLDPFGAAVSYFTDIRTMGGDGLNDLGVPRIESVDYHGWRYNINKSLGCVLGLGVQAMTQLIPAIILGASNLFRTAHYEKVRYGDEKSIARISRR
jgi:hypothetical protein